MHQTALKKNFDTAFFHATSKNICLFSIFFEKSRNGSPDFATKYFTMSMKWVLTQFYERGLLNRIPCSKELQFTPYYNMFNVYAASNENCSIP